MVQSTRHSSSWPVGQGEMAECIRRHDWAATALGPIAGWPPHLRTAVDICLASPLPIAVLWGEQRLQLYNDAYRTTVLPGHHAMLGRPALENWAEARDLIGPVLDRVFTSGEPGETPNFPVLREGAAGVPVERSFAFTFSAIRDRYGRVAGAFHTALETTPRSRIDAWQHEAVGAAGPETDVRVLSQVAPPPSLSLASPESHVIGANDGAASPPRHLSTAMLDSIPDYIYAFDREHRFAYINRTMHELFGPAQDVIGKTFQDLGYPAPLVERLDGHLRHIFDTGETVEDEVYFTSPSGARAYYQFVWGPVRGEGGRIEQVVGVSRDTSERRRMEERLRQGEARQSFLLQLGDRVRGLVDTAQIMTAVTEMVGLQLRVGRCGYGEVSDCGQFFVVERDWTDGAMPSLAGRVRLGDFGAAVVDQYRAGQTVVLDDTLEDPRTRGAEQAYAEAGRVRAGVGVPLFKGGRLVAAFYVHQSRPRHWRDEEVALLGEVAERIWAAVARARAERALRESERRYRTLFDALDEGFCLLEKVDTAPERPSDYRYLVTNPAFVTHTGIGGVIGRTMREVFPDASGFWYDTFDSVIGSGEAFRFDHGLINRGRVFDVYACRLDDGTRRRVAVLFNDITERKRHEQHQRLLLHELNHRVKNTLVTVQSMAMQSFRVGVDPELARLQFEGRLMALSRAHDILTRESWGRAPLAEIVHEAIAPYRDQHHDRLQADGPPVWLPPRHSLAFAMVLHELGTNAVKYGALSNQDGQIAIQWQADGKLRLKWTESGGPPVEPPKGRGFGSRLIERGLRHEIGGRVALEFAPAGVVCTIEVSLDGAGPLDHF